MALAADDYWGGPGPIPAELMEGDEHVERSEAEQRIDEAFSFADDHDLPVAQAIEMLHDAEPERGWLVDDDDDAEWALRKLAAATAELDALRARAHGWQERIQAWFEQAARQPARDAEFFSAHIEWYARRQRAEHERKSFALPSGKVSTRSTAACAEVDDEAAVLAWVDAAHGPERSAVAPPQPRKIYVSELRKVVEVVEVVDRARLVLSDGELIDVMRSGYLPPVPDAPPDDESGDIAIGYYLRDVVPQVGDGWPSPEDAEALVAQVEVIESHAEVRDADGGTVPGVVVRPESVSVTVAVTS